MSLLTVIQAVARQSNYPQPATVISNTDSSILLMLDCLQNTGDEMVERWDWQNLKTRVPVTFTGDGTTAAWNLPSDFHSLSPAHKFISSLYPTVNMPGPTNEEDLLVLKSLSVAIQPSCWREVNNQIEFYPVLAAGEIVSYVYAHNAWVLNSAGVPYSIPQPQADTDTFAFSERLLRLGAIWRWRMAKGLQYAEQMEDFEQAFNRKTAKEETNRVINMTSVTSVDWETFFPGTITDLTDQNY